MIRRSHSISFVLALGAALLVAGQASATDLGKLLENEHGPDKFRVIHVQDLASMMAESGHRVWIYDANHPSLREKAGIVPGAHLLSSYKDYDLSELTPDKNAQLVFYCADLHWMASHEAARRAVSAGYTNVAVMADGIKGWLAMNEPVDHVDAQHAAGGM